MFEYLTKFFIYFRCIQGEENRVMFYLNEYSVQHPECEVGLCSWSQLYNRYKANAEPNSCNFDFCTTGHANRIISSLSWLSTMVCVIFFYSTFQREFL